MIGSSVAFGSRVHGERTFATLLPREIQQQTRRKVELYNEGIYAWGAPHVVALHFHEVLPTKPDLILEILTPWDIENATITSPPTNPALPGFMGMTRYRIKEALANKSLANAFPEIREALNDLLTSTGPGYMLQHFLYKSQSQYVNSHLIGADDTVGFLKAVPSPVWERRLQQFDSEAAHMEAQATAAGVPFVAVLIPNRAQAAMISMGKWPDGYDPYKLDNELRAIITRHGGIYIDILPGYRALPNPEEDYFPVDGHPNASGHAIISGMLAKALTNGSIPALKAATQPQAGLEKQK
jgi:hypothetical protein